MLAIQDTPEKQVLVEEQEPRQFLSKSRRLNLVGLPKTTGLRMIKNMAEKRRAIRMGQAYCQRETGFTSKFLLLSKRLLRIGSDTTI